MTSIGRIGFLADTHSMKADGSDLPDQVLRAFKDVDLIVHLGDIGRKGIIDRLGEVAPVMVPFGGNKGYVPAGASAADKPVKALNAGAQRVGIAFNLAQPDKKIGVSRDTLTFPDDAPFNKLMARRFGGPVVAAAYGGTHCQAEVTHEGVLFFNPGSPTLPDDKRGDKDLGSVAVLDVRGRSPKVKLVRLSR